MADRLQIDPNIRTPALRPVASPVDTFVAPSKGRGLAQLAQGLSQLSPALARFTDTYAENVRTTQTAKGEAMARHLSAAGESYANAVKNGHINPSDNPFFVAGAKEQFGRVEADRWHDALVAGIGSDETLRTSTDLKDFDDYVQKHRMAWSASGDSQGIARDPFFDNGFMARADIRVQQEREQFARGIGQKIEKMSDDAQFAEIQSTVKESIGKVPLEQLARDITSHNDLLLAHGRNARQTNLTTARSIQATAIQLAQSGDPRAVDALSLLHMVTGGTDVIGNTSYGTELFNEGQKAVNMELDNAHDRQRRMDAEARQDRTRSAAKDFVDTLLTNPHADGKPFLARVADDPEASSLFASLASNVGRLAFSTDEHVMTRLFTGVYNGGTSENTVLSALNAGSLTVADASSLMSQLAAVRAANERGGAGKPDAIFDDFSFKGELGNLKARFADPYTGFPAGVQADKAAHAEAMLRSSWLKYRTGEGANASIADRNAWLVRESSAIVASQRGEEGEEQGTASPAADLSGNLQAEWKAKPVLDQDGLRRIQTEMRAGHVSGETRALLSRYNITTPEQFGAFIRAQLTLATTPSSPSKP